MLLTKVRWTDNDCCTTSRQPVTDSWNAVTTGNVLWHKTCADVKGITYFKIVIAYSIIDIFDMTRLRCRRSQDGKARAPYLHVLSLLQLAPDLSHDRQL